tara:strand:- start:1351 stop:1749 length:399 start_codon:yes stop_codon:yes gene_type:complete
MIGSHQSYILITWPNSIRIKYHPMAMRTVSNNFRTPTESYMIPPDIWELYKDSYYYSYENKYNIPNIISNSIWDKFNEPSNYDDEISIRIITDWINQYNFKNKQLKTSPIKCDKPSRPHKSKQRYIAITQYI